MQLQGLQGCSFLALHGESGAFSSQDQMGALGRKLQAERQHDLEHQEQPGDMLLHSAACVLVLTGCGTVRLSSQSRHLPRLRALELEAKEMVANRYASALLRLLLCFSRQCLIAWQCLQGKQPHHSSCSGICAMPAPVPQLPVGCR